MQRLDPFLGAALAAKEFHNGDPHRLIVAHLMNYLEELLEYTALEAGSPSRYWTYMAESWGGWLATTRAKRGGANNPFPSLTELDPEISGCHC